MKKCKRFLAVFLSLALLASVFTSAGISGEEAAPSPDLENAEPRIIGEAENLREKHVKVYERDDGVNIAVVSMDAVHYQDEEGNWQDIDNMLKEENGVLTNRENSMSVEIPQNIKDNEVAVEQGGRRVSFQLLGNVMDTAPEVKPGGSISGSAVDTEILQNKVSSLIYEDVLNQVDIAYDVEPEGLKESIILKEKPAGRAIYQYQITANGLEAVLEADNSIRFYEEGNGETVFHMPAPYMFDSSEASEYNDDIELSLTRNGEKYILTYKPSLVWLQDEARVYPVTIDPTINTYGAADAYVKSSAPTANYSNVDTLEMSSTNYGTALLKMPIPNKVTLNAISKATLTVNMANAYEDSVMEIRPITSAWTPSTVTWNTRPGTGSYCDVVTVHGGQTEYVFDVTAVVSNVSALQQEYYGLALNTSSTRAPATAMYGYKSSSKPLLKIEYRRMEGVTPNTNHHELNAGRAGTAYINDFNGKLAVQRRDIGFDGNIMPVDISLGYMIERPVLVDDYAEQFFPQADQWIPNYYRRLGEYVGQYGRHFAYLNENGAAITFKNEAKTDTESVAEYEDEEGLGYVLVYDKLSSQTKFAKYTLQKPDGTEETFDRYGMVTKIRSSDNAQGEITITYPDRSSFINTITDGAGRKYQFQYDSDDNITAIQYYGTGTTVLEQVAYTYTNGCLTGVTYPDGETVAYEYDARGRITKMTDIDGYSLSYTYTADSGNPQVARVDETAGDDTAGSWITVTYRHLRTTYRDNQGHYENIRFDTDGNVLSTMDNKYNFIGSEYGARGSLMSVSTTGSAKKSFLSDKNLVQNGDFTTLNAGFNSGADQWTLVNSTTDTVQTAAMTDHPTYLSDASFRLVGGVNTAKALRQRIAVDGKAGDIFSFGGWGRGSALPLENEGFGQRTFGMRVEVLKENSATETEAIASFDYNPYLSNLYQYKTASVQLPRDAQWVDLYIVYEHQRGNAYFDGIEFTKDGYALVSGETAGNETAGAGEWDGAAPIDRSVEEQSHTDPETGRRTVSSVSSAGVGQTSVYDAYGNELSSAVDNGREKIETRNTYTESGNYLASSTSPEGIETGYCYDEQRGRLQSVTDANGNATSYTYDTIGQLTGVSLGSASNSYTYEKDKLKTITHNGFTYSFEYDVWGAQTGVKVNNTTLVSNTYNNSSHGRTLSRMNYGNGGRVYYTYNDDNQVTGIKYDTDTDYRFTYTYDEYGTLTSKTDYVNGQVTKYDEDGEISVWNLDETTELYRCTSDENGVITQTIGSTAATQKNTQDNDGKATGSTVTSGGAVLSQSEVRYDDLGRVTAKSTGNGGEEALFWEYYGYQHKMGQKTTNQLRSIQVQGEGFQKEYAYTYDTMGNIASIATENGQTRYFYDSLNQLTRVDDAAQNKTVTYSYDNGGNILSVQEYAYTNGELTGSAAVTKTYVYDANWKDKLASFDGKAITYDQIGNPISYDGWAYTWEAGRQLKSLSKAGVSIAYKYDDTGFRTQKTVNGTTTDYLVLENRILQQSDGTNTITFRYDGENKAASFNLNGAEYYYLRNLQEDIIGIVDGTGSLVVEYAYDAWGKLLSITGSLADTVGVLNPLRYRGYYYDTETGLYYLQSRYYNPEWGRFINADTVIDNSSIIGANLYTYCLNTPVNMYDSGGQLARWISKLTTASLVTLSLLRPWMIFCGINYYRIKQDISAAGLTFLYASGNILSGRMFRHALYGNGRTIDRSISNLMRLLLESSEELKAKIRTAISNAMSRGRTSFCTGNIGIEFKDKDLYYAIQHADLWLSGYRVNRRWYITVTICDKYDFSEFRKGLSFSNLANNLGWALQRNGMMKTYYWSLKYTYRY